MYFNLIVEISGVYVNLIDVYTIHKIKAFFLFHYAKYTLEILVVYITYDVYVSKSIIY